MPIPMTFSVVRWFVPAQTGIGIVPAGAYLAKFFEAGTDTPKAIYDVDGTIYPSPANVAILNEEGYAALKLGPGAYKLRICLPEEDPSPTGGDAVYTEDNISGVGNFGTGFVDSVIASDDPATNGLAQLDTNANRWTFAGGYWAKGDGGHGMFWNETSEATADGGYVIASTFDPTKRWFRVPDESDDVRAEAFGYVSSKSGNLGDNLLAAAAYCVENDKRLVIGPGNVATIGNGTPTYTLVAPAIYFEPGSVVTGHTETSTIVIQALVSGSHDQHFVGDALIEFDFPNIFDAPEWFGAKKGVGDIIAASNTTAFQKWIASAYQQSTLIVPPGNWPYTDTDSFPDTSPSPIIFLGRMVTSAGETEDIPTGVRFPADSSFTIGDLHFLNLVFSDGSILKKNPTDTGAFFDGKLAVNDDLHGGNDIVAANFAIGKTLLNRGGGSGQYFAARALYSYNITTVVSPDNASLNPLMDSTIIANLLDKNGSGLEIFCEGSRVGGVVANTHLDLIFAGHNVGKTWTDVNIKYWSIRARLIISAPNTFSLFCEFYADIDDLVIPVVTGNVTVPFNSVKFDEGSGLGFDSTIDNLLQVKYSDTTSNGGTQFLMTVDYIDIY